MDSIDIDKEIAEIRRFKAKGWSDRDIMRQLNIPQATFYRYKSRMKEQMAELLAQQSKETLMEDVELCKVRLEDCLRRIEVMLDSVREDGKPSLTPSQTNAYIAQKAEISLTLGRLQREAQQLITGVKIEATENTEYQRQVTT